MQNNNSNKMSSNTTNNNLNNIKNEECKGSLIFQVSSSKGALPIKNAKVQLSRQISPDIYYYKELITDISGKTPPLCVFAPEKNLSLSPDNSKPYFSYHALIDADGYRKVKLDDIRAFEGITSMQSVTLEPVFFSE